jgi:hypothetical protein
MTRYHPFTRPLSLRAQAYAAAWRGWCARNRANFQMLSRREEGPRLEVEA